LAIGNQKIGNGQLTIRNIRNTAFRHRQSATGNSQHGNPQHGNPEHGNPQHRNPQHGNPPLTIRKIGNRQLPIGNSNNSIAFRTHLLYSSRQFVQDSGPP
jgi:hypothetical protein